MFKLVARFLLYLNLVGVVVFSTNVFAQAKTRYILLNPGQVRVLDVQSVERVAIGNESIANYKISSENEIIIIGVSTGDTTLHIWRKGNRQEKMQIQVSAGNLQRRVAVAKRLVRDMPGVTVSRLDDYILFEGVVSVKKYGLLEAIVNNTPGGVLLAEAPSFDKQSIAQRVAVSKRLVQSMPGVIVSSLDNQILFEGEVSVEKLDLLTEIVANTEGGILLAETPNFDKQPMVRIDVNILEVSRNDIKNIGINWSDSLAGPAGAIFTNVIKSDAFGIASEDPNGAITDEIIDSLASNASGFYDYLGITSSITSQINLIEETGAGKILASPKLVAASGSEATFQSGGSFPIPAISATGVPTVSFQNYGIILDIVPVVEGSTIRANVSAVVSTIDFSVVVNGIPGLLSRDTSTTINMLDGNTIAISGLASISDAKGVDKLPFFGDLPILGPLFRTTSTRQEEKEVIILVTMNLIEPGDELDSSLQEDTVSHIEELKKLKTISVELMD